MHVEHQPHVYAVAWTTSRETDPSATPVDNGGNFFLATHGVRFQASANSLLIWRPGLWHGTSLSLQDPRKATTLFCQRGLAFVTSSRLPEAWRRYQSKMMHKSTAERWLLEHEPPTNGTDLPPDEEESSSPPSCASESPLPPSIPPSRTRTLSDICLAEFYASEDESLVSLIIPTLFLVYYCPYAFCSS